jgi:hypothetical protein
MSQGKRSTGSKVCDWVRALETELLPVTPPWCRASKPGTFDVQEVESACMLGAVVIYAGAGGSLKVV